MKKPNIIRIALSAKPLILLLFSALMPSLASAQCPDNNHPHMINLGLPSGTLWACCNVGASTPEGYGGYYAWGETEEKESYTWENYIHADGEYGTSHDIGTDIAGTEYDVAHVKWKGSWQMPSQAQVKELVENCTREWETQGAINGYTFTGPNGNTIFVPVAGFIFDSTNIFDNNDGRYWTSSLGPSDCERAYYLFLNNENVSCDNYDNRQLGCSVRPIITTPNIIFADDAVKAICVENWDTDNDGELSYAEAAAVTDIGYVFQRKSITSFEELQYFTGLTSIGNSAFASCHNLTSIIIPVGVTSVGNTAFHNCYNITSLIIPGSVTSIGKEAFFNCNRLTTLSIPASVNSLGEGAFAACSNLISVIVESGNTVYDSRENCNAIIETASATLIFGCQNTIIPNSVTAIGERAFDHCGKLTSITIPNSVTSIGSMAFSSCDRLVSITIPNSVTNIGERVFASSDRLTSIIVENGNTIFDSRENCNAIIKTTDNELIVGCKNTIIPNTVARIGNNAFFWCHGLTSITIPNGVTSIGNRAFWECSALTEVNISNSVTSIEDHAFHFCESLPSVVIPSSVTNMGISVFGGCFALTSIIVDSENPVYDSRDNCNAIIMTANNELIEGCINTTIPNSVISIGEYSFEDCETLTSISIPNSVTSIGNFAFGYCPDLTTVISYITEPFILTATAFPFSMSTLYVPYGTKEKYEATPAWNLFADIVEMESPNIEFADETVKALCVANWDTDGDGELNYAEAAAVNDLGEVFHGNTEISSFDELQYFTGLTTIGNGAFNNCSGLTSVIIPNSVTSIEASAFDRCDSLTEVTIPNSVTVIGNCAFVLCRNLTSVIIPNSVTIIDDSAFYGCSGLTSVTFPSSLTSIGNYAFEDCSGLTELYIPKNITTIGNGAFVGCSGLTSIVVDSDNTVYDSHDNCNAIINTASWTLIAGCNTTVIPDRVTSIGDYAFSKCTGLTEMNIPDGITRIGMYAFNECSGLPLVTIPNSVNSIGYGAFWGCDGLTEMTIPNSVVTIGNMAFSACNGLTSLVVESGNPVYDSRDNCNAIIETANATLIAGCKSSVIPNNVNTIGKYAFYHCSSLREIIISDGVTSIGNAAFSGCNGLEKISFSNSLTSIGEWAFYDCGSLTDVTIPNSVNAIGDFAFAECNGLTSVTSYIEKPFEISNYVFMNWNSDTYQDEFTTATLYVPAGTKAKYEATPAWNLFENIVEMDMEPVENGETVDFAEEIDEDTNLDGNVVGDIYYNISDEDGSYDAEEGCIVVTTPTDDDTMSELEGQDIFGEDFKDGFTGIVFKVAPGKGTINVEAQTTGSMVLKVKIGNAYPITKELEGKLKVTFPYNVAEETYVYIYGGNNATQAKGMKKADANGELRIYGIEIFRNTAPTDIDSVTQYPISNQEAVYDLQGRKIGTDMHEASPYKRGINIMRLGDGTTRKVVVK